ncbi:hypothetical protein ACE38W_14525 [Chitinophaga sp. Hz27]|uniref:hypothetical protein n=1 Tax=Chitinophaga sp. Hz27 TaxID=3347169 RepID=UPI0035D8AC51
MAIRISIDFEGFDTKRLEAVKDDLLAEIDGELTAAAYLVKLQGDRDAPKDEGNLKAVVDNSVFLEKSVSYPVFFAPYQEFGTGSKVKIPAGYEDYAKAYQGPAKRGNIDDFFEQMIQWVRRNNITGTYSVKTRRRLGNKTTREAQDKEAAHAIMYSILKHGVTPRPYFIPALEAGKAEAMKRIKEILKRYSG